MPSRALRAAAAAVALCLTPAADAWAARTDAIVLLNGDRFTGEVVQMRQGKLEVKTDDAGTLSIEWDKVASITTADQYELVMRDGTRILGRFRPGAARVLQIVPESGGNTPAPMTEIASFARIKSGLLQRVDGSFDLGGSYTKSSEIGELYLDTRAKYRRPSYAFAASLGANLTHQPDEEDTSRYALKVSYTRYLGSRWFVSALGFFESNEELGFTVRSTGAGSIGRYLVRSNHVEFVLTGGLAAGRETPVDSAAVFNTDALLAADLSIFAYDYPTTRFDIAVLVFPSLDDPGRVRLNADVKLRREIFKDFFVAVTGYDAFDNRPRTVAATRNDFGGSLSFGLTF
jgi:hypothetical protein